MTKQEFINFSLSQDYVIKKFARLVNDRSWSFNWKYLKNIIVNNNISFENIVIILEVFKDYDIKLSKKKFIKFICAKFNEGFSVFDIIVSLSFIEYLGNKKWTKPVK